MPGSLAGPWMDPLGRLRGSSARRETVYARGRSVHAAPEGLVRGPGQQASGQLRSPSGCQSRRAPGGAPDDAGAGARDESRAWHGGLRAALLRSLPGHCRSPGQTSLAASARRPARRALRGGHATAGRERPSAAAAPTWTTENGREDKTTFYVESFTYGYDIVWPHRHTGGKGRTTNPQSVPHRRSAAATPTGPRSAIAVPRAGCAAASGWTALRSPASAGGPIPTCARRRA